MRFKSIDNLNPRPKTDDLRRELALRWVDGTQKQGRLMRDLMKALRAEYKTGFIVHDN